MIPTASRVAMTFASWITAFFRASGAGMRASARGVMLAIATGFLALPVHAVEGIFVKSAMVEPVEGGWQLEAEFDIQFTQRLEEAVNRGVPLYFVVEFELSRPRW